MTITLGSGDIVLAINKGDNPVTVMYDSKAYRLEPGKTIPMPFDCAVLWFGDPRAGGVVGSVVDERGLRSWIPDRETEVRRLRTKYDNQMGDERFIVNHPVVELRTVDTNEIIPTILDDPSGERAAAAAAPKSQDMSDLESVVMRQSKMIDLLMAERTNRQAIGDPGNPGFVQQTAGPDSTRTSDTEQYTSNKHPVMQMAPPPIPGVPNATPLPDDLARNVVEVDEIPQDGSQVPAAMESEQVDLSELPQDGATHAETEPPATGDAFAAADPAGSYDTPPPPPNAE